MASNWMGKIHPSKPATENDKTMSKRHKKTRKWIDKLKTKKEKLEASVEYNPKHEREHRVAGEKAKNELSKLKKTFNKFKKGN